jgi:hypothetical protein
MTNDFDLDKARSDLMTLRNKHGAETAIGHRCSNLLEQLQNLEGATGDEHRRVLQKLIGRSLAELAELTR